MNMRCLPATLPALLLALAFPPHASAQPAPTQSPSGQTLRIALAEDADMLDPTLARTFVGRIVFAGLCDKLFDIDAKLTIVPQLATGYEWPDSKTLLLHLRANVLFQDGTKLDADAVKYSLERHLTMQGSGRRGELASIDHIEVVDPLTVRLVLKGPSSPLLAQLTDRAGMIVSPKAATASGKDFALHPVCAGPFSFTERVPQDRIVLDRFPQYWNAPAIHFARVIYQPTVNSSVRLTNLQAGAVDLAERIQPSDTDAVRKDAKLRLVTSSALGFWGLTFNIAHGPRAKSPIGQSEKVRKAFELSIDRDAINQVVYGGLYVPTAQAVPQDSPYYAKDIPIPPRDVARARALLAEAGVKLPVPVSMMEANSPDVQQMAEVIQSMAAEAGFDVKLQVMEFASTLDAEDRGDFEVYLSGWSGRPDPDGNLWNFLHSGAPLNDTGYANPAVDGWLEQARATTDIAARTALYAKVGMQTEQDLPVTYLYTPKNIVGMTAKLTGFQPVPDGLIRLQNLAMTP
jgi:peptide/nickel transport system substrate-binding protein